MGDHNDTAKQFNAPAAEESREEYDNFIKDLAKSIPFIEPSPEPVGDFDKDLKTADKRIFTTETVGDDHDGPDIT